MREESDGHGRGQVITERRSVSYSIVLLLALEAMAMVVVVLIWPVAWPTVGVTVVAEGSVLVVAALALVVWCSRSMLRRQGKASLASAFGLAAVVWLLAFAPGATFSRTELNSEGFTRIANGMTLAQVEDLLGGSPGNYGRYIPGAQTDEGYPGPPGSDLRFWSNDNERFEIAFTSGRVVDKHMRAGYESSPTIASRIRRLLDVRAVGSPRGLEDQARSASTFAAKSH